MKSIKVCKNCGNLIGVKYTKYICPHCDAPLSTKQAKFIPIDEAKVIFAKYFGVMDDMPEKELVKQLYNELLGE